MLSNNIDIKVHAIIALIVILLISSVVYSANLKLLKSKKFNIAKEGKLSLESDFGDVKISSWNELAIEIKIFGTDKVADEVRFYFDKTANDITIKLEKKKNLSFNFFCSNSLKFEIKMPKNYSSEISIAGGDISANELKGAFEFNTSGGDVKMANNLGNARVFTSGGNIEIKNHKGEIKAETSGGDIKIQNLGNIDCETSGGDIDIIAENGSVNAETSGGDIELKYWGSNKGIFCKTSGGDINCILPKNFKADVDLKTLGGEVDIDFANANTSKITHSKFFGKFNGGGEKIECSTTGGSIKVISKNDFQVYKFNY